MTVIHSADQGLITQELHKILGNDFGLYQQVIYESPNQLTGLLHAQGMFEVDEKRMIVLGCNFLSNQSEATTAEDLITVLNMNRTLRVYLTVEQDKLLTKNKSINDFLESVNVINIPKLTNYTMQTWIAGGLANDNISLTFEQLSMFMSRVVPNAMVIDNEIAKLRLFKKRDLTNQLLQNLLFEYNNDSVFKLVEYVLLKKSVQALQLFDSLTPQRYTPLEILQIMASQTLKIVFVARALVQGLTQTETTQSLGISFYQYNNMKKVCHQASIKVLQRFLNGILWLDIKIKKKDINDLDSVRLFLTKGVTR